jgi:hypothetical protein
LSAPEDSPRLVVCRAVKNWGRGAVGKEGRGKDEGGWGGRVADMKLNCTAQRRAAIRSERPDGLSGDAVGVSSVVGVMR